VGRVGFLYSIPNALSAARTENKLTVLTKQAGVSAKPESSKLVPLIHGTTSPGEFLCDLCALCGRNFLDSVAPIASVCGKSCYSNRHGKGLPHIDTAWTKACCRSLRAMAQRCLASSSSSPNPETYDVTQNPVLESLPPEPW
jgi:hypothetical protein